MAEIVEGATLLVPAVSAKLTDQGEITQTTVTKVHSEPIVSRSLG